jgi:hypothetical protein
MTNEDRKRLAVNGWATSREGVLADVAVIELNTRSDEPAASKALHAIAHAFDVVLSRTYGLKVPKYLVSGSTLRIGYLFPVRPKQPAELTDERGLPAFANATFRSKGQSPGDPLCSVELQNGFRFDALAKWLENSPYDTKRAAVSQWPYPAAEFLAGDLFGALAKLRSEGAIVFSYEDAKAVPFVKRGPLTVADMSEVWTSEA